MTILVTYGSERGGTEGLAKMLGQALEHEGLAVEVKPPREVKALAPYEAVVVGGALYAVHWHRAARRFVKRHARELRERPTWLFSSGPLDASAEEHEIDPVPQVRKLMERIDARGHETFGGRLEPHARGFIASSMARKHAGDWRSEAHVEHWARGIAAAVRTEPAHPHPSDALGERRSFHWRWIGACALAELVGITAVAAMAVITAGWGPPATWLARLGVWTAFLWAGAVEGLALGMLQHRVLRERLPLLPHDGWVGVTAVVAVLGWGAGMGVPVFLGGVEASAGSAPEPGLGQVLLMAAGLGAVAGALFGTAQAWVLRQAAEGAGRWIAIHVPAWALAMAAIFAGASIPGAGWPAWSIVLSGAAGGLVAGALLGAVSGFVARSLTPKVLAAPSSPARPAVPQAA